MFPHHLLNNGLLCVVAATILLLVFVGFAVLHAGEEVRRFAQLGFIIDALGSIIIQVYRLCRDYISIVVCNNTLPVS